MQEIANASTMWRGRRPGRGVRVGALGVLCLAVSLAATARAQAPAPMAETGCCCIAIKGGQIGCGQKSQAECLAEQPKTPMYAKLPDWAKAVANSEAQEGKAMKTGWHAGKCP
jgi:hypothetical protein